MPCDTIQTVGVDLGKVDPGLLTLALTELGLNPQKNGNRITFYGGSYDTTTKTATLSSSRMAGTNAEELTAKIKRAYSAEVVKATAKRYGWQIKETEPYKFQVIKNSF